jgi:hypothetical protein
MQVHNNKRLFELAQRQAQSQCLAEMAQGPNKALLSLWNGKPHTYHPETPLELKNAYARCAAVHDEAATPSLALRKLRTSSSKKAFAWLLAELIALPNDEYLASFGAIDCINFDNEDHWIPHLPVTQIKSTEVIAVFRASEDLPFEELALASVGGGASLVLDSYIGFIPDEPSKDEIVYELATFRDA